MMHIYVGPNMIQGYAYSGGGRGIVRVDVSCDGGLNWKTASLTAGSEQPLDRFRLCSALFCYLLLFIH
jgi:hypothetical protein